MAKGAQKRIASANAQATSTLLYGLAATNAVFWIAHTLLWPTSAWRTWTLYVLSEGVAGALALQLLSMARAGDDLRQRGLTAYVKGTHGRYMWDVVYLTWFVHVAVSLVSPVFWWTYATVPMYGAYVLYTKVIAPMRRRGAAPPATAAAPDEPALSKRQAKLQARQQRGTKVQVRRG